jgi:large subunit ribosomal protein L23
MSNKDPRDIIIRPVVSEKSYAGYDNNVYTFVVATDANKIEIRKAIEVLFNKRVAKVATINRKGKRSRNRFTGGYNAPAREKRAIVTLAPGEDRIDIFGS